MAGRLSALSRVRSRVSDRMSIAKSNLDHLQRMQEGARRELADYTGAQQGRELFFTGLASFVMLIAMILWQLYSQRIWVEDKAPTAPLSTLLMPVLVLLFKGSGDGVVHRIGTSMPTYEREAVKTRVHAAAHENAANADESATDKQNNGDGADRAPGRQLRGSSNRVSPAGMSPASAVEA